jgi:hypothetical protein
MIINKNCLVKENKACVAMRTGFVYTLCVVAVYAVARAIILSAPADTLAALQPRRRTMKLCLT